MTVKKICAAAVCVIYSVMLTMLYKGKHDILMIFSGIDIRNNIYQTTLHFMGYSSLVFLSFGEAEKFISGYGKYVLIRNCKRARLADRILLIRALTAGVFELIRAVVYITLGGIHCSDTRALFMYMLTDLLVNIFLLFMQTVLEIGTDSKTAVASVMAYFIISCMLGGVLIGKQIYIPIYCMIPNYSMQARVGYTGISDRASMCIPAVGAIFLIFIGRKLLTKKDIY